MESTLFCVLFLDAVFHAKISVWSLRGVHSGGEEVHDTEIYQYQTAHFVVSYPFQVYGNISINEMYCLPTPNVSFSSWHQAYPPGQRAWSLEDNGVYAIVNLTQTPDYLDETFWVDFILDDAKLELEGRGWRNDPFVYFYLPEI